MAIRSASAAVNVPRDGHFVRNPVTGLYQRSLLLEGGGTNLCLQSENFGVTWVAEGTPTRTPAAIAASVMGVALDLLGDDDAGVDERYYQIVAFTGDATKALSVFMKKGPAASATGNTIVLRDTTAPASRMLATITWDGSGVPTVVMAAGVHLGTPIAYPNGVYRFRFQCPGVIAANNNRIYVPPGRFGTAGDTGDVYVGGVQAENALVPTSYIKTTTVTVARSADSLSDLFALAPQEMTVYAKFIEGGSAHAGTTMAVLYIGNAAQASPYLRIYSSSNGYCLTHHSGALALTTTALAQPPVGALVELRATLGADGVGTLHQSINGAGETASAPTAVNALQPAWSDTKLWLNSLGSAGPGLNAFLEDGVKIIRGIQTLAYMRAA